MAGEQFVVVPFHRHPGISGFDSGTAALDDWLKTLARQQESKGVSRVFMAEEAATGFLVGYSA